MISESSGETYSDYVGSSEHALSHMQSFVEIKSSQNGEITLSFIYEGKSCHICDFFTSQICLLCPGHTFMDHLAGSTMD